MRAAVAILGVVMALMSGCASREKNLVEELMRSRPEWFGPILGEVERYEVQILYTQIDRDAENVPRFTSHPYRVDPDSYFYPASTIKLAGALMALEKLNTLDIEGLDRNTPLRIDSTHSGQTAVVEDESSADGEPSIGHYVKKVFVVSDNDAYNRLYEFVGQRQLNEGLWAKGYEDVRLTHRLSVFLTADENRHTNPITFFRDGRVVYQQPAVFNPQEIRASRPILKGIGYKVDGKLVDEPKDFADSNFMSIDVLQGLLRSALFPDSVPVRQRFDLSEDDYGFLYSVMGMLPRESKHPTYDSEEYYDSYVKFLLFGDSKERMPDGIRLVNKVGQAYGYLIDNAYVVDFEKGVEFLLTAVISVNENRIYNDDEYEYDEVGFPFLANLGRLIYEYETRRPRVVEPDLSRFAVEY